VWNVGRFFRALLAVVLLSAALAGGPAEAGTGIEGGSAASPAANATASDPGAEIVAVLPNPIAPADRGEYVVLSIPNGTNVSGWSIADGESVARLPNRTVGGRIVVSTTPAAVNASPPVLGLDGRLALANGGERVRLTRGNHTLDAVGYQDAPEGEQYVRDEGGWTWRPPGMTDRPVVGAAGVPTRAFVLPDSPGVPVETLDRARDRILLAGYTIADPRVLRALCDARERGVRVRVLAEAEPVGGLTRRMAGGLDRLVECGVPVRVLGGERDRYAFHHPKYAVVDDRAIVLTENWKQSGTGGRSSRGWGAVVRGGRVSGALAAIFRADAGFRGATPWPQYRSERTFAESPPVPTERYPDRFEPRSTNATRVSVLAAPDNAASEIVERIDSATESIRVEQISIGSRGHPFVRALLRAARRGVEVRVLLGSASYVRAGNRAIAEWLTARATAEGLPLAVRLATPRSRFGKIHAKGIVIDDAVVLGSINWTNGSIRENREVALVIEDPAVAGYYRQVIRADWRGGIWSAPVGLVGLAALAIAGAVLMGSRLEFDPGYSVSPDAAVESYGGD
jgi:phosphatidylserine/phosphatidylglycerophosphate/cardiolipin synthase-like enzyme